MYLRWWETSQQTILSFTFYQLRVTDFDIAVYLPWFNNQQDKHNSTHPHTQGHFHTQTKDCDHVSAKACDKHLKVVH